MQDVPNKQASLIRWSKVHLSRAYLDPQMSLSVSYPITQKNINGIWPGLEWWHPNSRTICTLWGDHVHSQWSNKLREQFSCVVSQLICVHCIKSVVQHTGGHARRIHLANVNNKIWTCLFRLPIASMGKWQTLAALLMHCNCQNQINWLTEKDSSYLLA